MYRFRAERIHGANVAYPSRGFRQELLIEGAYVDPVVDLLFAHQPDQVFRSIVNPCTDSFRRQSDFILEYLVRTP